MLAVFLWPPAFLVYGSKESGERFLVTHIVAVFIRWRGGWAKAEGVSEGGWEEGPRRQQTAGPSRPSSGEEAWPGTAAGPLPRGHT